MTTDPWAVLGVEAGTGYAEARRAYLVRSRLLHPDRHHDAGADVLAEAERAMRELNEAWDAVRVALAAAASAAAGPAAGLGLAADAGPQESVDWVLGRLARAAGARGDPLLPDELARLRSAAAAVRPGRSFQRWLSHRRHTLEQAIEDDAASAGGLDAWTRALRAATGAATRPVLLLLLDHD